MAGEAIKNFTVVSFNCWGIPIPGIVKDYKTRMKAISEALFNNDKFDVICLQEIWSKRAYDTFQWDAKDKFRYSHYFYSGFMGSGVCVFSKYPIVDVLFHKWQVNGYIHKITHGDWYGGKGIGLCKLDVDGFKVNVYTCHTHAQYNDSMEYLTHQVVQSYDTAQFIRMSSQNVDLAVLAADLNIEPEKLCYRIIKHYAELEDSFDPEHNCTDFEGTYDCPRNSYRSTNAIDEYPGQRIDYILYKVKSAAIECISYDMPLKERIASTDISYSDHEAICATFRLQRSDEKYNDSTNRSEALLSLEDAACICEKAVKKLEYQTTFNRLLVSALIWTIILAVVFSIIFLYFRSFASLSVIVITFSVLLILRLVLLLIVYVWKKIELNGILCALHGIQISLDMIRVQVQ